MKIVLYLLIITAAGFAGWVAQPGLYTWLKDRKDTRLADKAKEHAAIKQQGKEEANGGSNANFNAKVLDALINRGSAPTSPTAPSPGSVGTNTTASNNTPATTRPASTAPPVDEIEARYPLPAFKTIEEITKEWSAIPSRAFPRKVKTKVALDFDTAAGKVNLPTGSDARAAGMVAGMLIVMREGDDTSRVQVPLANTDLKETMTSLYEKYKDYRRNIVLKEREAARTRKAKANGATPDQMTKAGPRPDVRAGGVIPVMMDDIMTGKYSELKANSITSWGNLEYEEVDGAPYWTGTVQCTVENALFGPSPTEMMALIKDNKVVRWIYTGSREPVQ